MVIPNAMVTPLRVCRICGLEANTEAELEQFVRNRKNLYGYLNRCKKCHREDMKQRKRRTAEFIKIFRERSPDGVIRCYFCGEPILKLEGLRRGALHIHSLDEKHENWNPENKVPAHGGCHTSYHHLGEKSPNWKGDEASNSAKRKRVRHARAGTVHISKFELEIDLLCQSFEEVESTLSWVDDLKMNYPPSKEGPR